jgi:hypothetical protein
VREEVQTNKAAVGRQLLDLPGYVFRVFVTNRHDSPLEIWAITMGERLSSAALTPPTSPKFDPSIKNAA